VSDCDEYVVCLCVC